MLSTVIKNFRNITVHRQHYIQSKKMHTLESGHLSPKSRSTIVSKNNQMVLNFSFFILKYKLLPTSQIYLHLSKNVNEGLLQLK